MGEIQDRKTAERWWQHIEPLVEALGIVGPMDVADLDKRIQEKRDWIVSCEDELQSERDDLERMIELRQQWAEQAASGGGEVDGA